MRRRLPFFAAALLWSAPALAAPDVVVSIKPLHSLVSAVMAGTGSPRLLLDGGASPHSYALKPSDARALDDAEVVFLVGGGLERFLEKPLATFGAKAVAMAEMPGVQRLPLRQGGVWEAHEHHEHDHDHEHEDEHAEAFDSHLWLSPANAKAFVAGAAATLARLDPAAAATYRANAGRVTAEIDALDAELAALLEPARGKPYIVFHDAYHYFEDHYGLTPAGAISVDPEHQPGGKRVKEIQERLRKAGSSCVFREPQFSPKLVERLAGPQVRVGVLDPLGAEMPAGPSAWFATMRGMARSLRDCLAG